MSALFNVPQLPTRRNITSEHTERSFRKTESEKRLLLLIYGTKYSRMDQVKFVEDNLSKTLLGPFLNTLSHKARL